MIARRLAGAEHRIGSSNEGIAALAVAGAIPHSRLVASAIGRVRALGKKNGLGFATGHKSTSLTSASEFTIRKAKSQKPQFSASLGLGA